MIKLTDFIPAVRKCSAEWIKIRCNFECYPESCLFWAQDENRAYISLIDGNMVILNLGADLGELSEFVDVINPCCVFSDLETLMKIGRKPLEESYVMHKKADSAEDFPSDCLNSKQLYELLDVKGLSLPEYEYFAVDICRRLNHGFADYYAKLGEFAAISLKTGNYALMNGIASHKKGSGSVALRGISAKNQGRDFLACCRPQVSPFYEKNGFNLIYKVGYWVKTNEFL